MRILRLAASCVATVCLIAASSLLAHADSDWQKTYPVSGKASVFSTTGDASIEIRSCDNCREVRVRVEWNDRHASDYVITEFQSASHVTFEMKDKVHNSFHFNIGVHRSPHVTIDTPAITDLEARAEDGSVKVSGLQGTVVLKTGDGSLDVADVSGSLRLNTSDGSIRIHNGNGTLDARSSDGRVTIDGRFSALQVYTADGSLDVTLAEGSRLVSSSRLETGDGHVTLRLPRSFAAELNVDTGDGSIKNDLPLTSSGGTTPSKSEHSLRGRLNGGGPELSIHSGDGSVTITAI